MRIGFISTISLVLLAAGSILTAQDEEARRHVLHDLGGPFIVYRTNVQEELKLSESQKQKLLERLASDGGQATLRAVAQIERLGAGERGERMRAIRAKSYPEFWAFLREIMNAQQFERMHQLELQHEGPAALLGRPEIAQELHITDEQRKQFMNVVREMQRSMEPLQQEAHSGGDREAIRRRATRIYEQQEGKIEAILDDAQRIRWKEMFGKPFDVFNDN